MMQTQSQKVCRFACRPSKPRCLDVELKVLPHMLRCRHFCRPCLLIAEPLLQAGPACSVESKEERFLPEDYQLAQGELSFIDKKAEVVPEDVFRCVGCTKEACQGPGVSTCRLFCGCSNIICSYRFIFAIIRHTSIDFGCRDARSISGTRSWATCGRC